MNENIKKFLEKVARDPELTAKMRAVQDPDEAYRLASSLQDGFTKEDYQALVSKMFAGEIKVSGAIEAEPEVSAITVEYLGNIK